MLRPFGDTVIIEPDPIEDRKVGLILLADKVASPIRQGTVVAVGDGKLVDKYQVPLAVQAGDRVHYHTRTGMDVEDNGATYRLLDEDGILLANEHPLGADVLLQPIKQEEQITSTGVVIPAIAQKNSTVGTVIKVGVGRRDPATSEIVQRPAFEEGMLVIYNKFSAREVLIGEDEYVVVDMEDILGEVCSADVRQLKEGLK